jgi:hypothetical protein
MANEKTVIYRNAKDQAEELNTPHKSVYYELDELASQLQDNKYHNLDKVRRLLISSCAIGYY